MTSHLTVGKKGEDIAEEYLRGLRYVIIGRNVRTKGGEIDIIARQNDVVVFIEVKARKSNDGFKPSDRVDRKKINRLKGAAQVWIDGELKRGADEFPARIDVIGVCEGKIVEHFEDVVN